MVTTKICFFLANEAEQFVHLRFFDLGGHGWVGQLGSVGLDPQGDGAMMHPQMASNPAQVHPIYVQLDRLVTDRWWVSPGLWLWGVLDLAEHAAISLTATAGFAGSVLSFRSVTFGTCGHTSILAHFIATLSSNGAGMDVLLLV